MFYLVYLQDTELQIPAITMCKSQEDIGKVVSNLDKKYIVSGVEQFTAEFLDSHQELCSNPDELELGKGDTNVNE